MLQRGLNVKHPIENKTLLELGGKGTIHCVIIYLLLCLLLLRFNRLILFFFHYKSRRLG